MNIKKIGYNIMDAMTRQGCSISELARRLNRARSTVTLLINCPERMKFRELAEIAEALRVPASELLEGVS